MKIDLEKLKKINSDMQGHIGRIYEAARGAKKILEIGTCSGISTRVLLKVVQETDGVLYSVDIRDCLDAIPEENRKNWSFIKEDSQKLDLAPHLNNLDVLFIDGDHNIADKDFRRFEPLVNRGGKIIMHDVNNDEFPSIREFVNNLSPDKYGVVCYPDCHGLAIIRKL